MNYWRHLYFFDKNGQNYNFDYDESTDMWTGDIYLSEVSTNLFEVGQIFILEKLFNYPKNVYQFGFPHSYKDETTSATGGLDCTLEVEWESDDPTEIFLFQFDLNFVSQPHSSFLPETDGPPMLTYDTLSIALDYDDTQTIIDDDYVSTDYIRSEAIQINFAISSPDEDTFKRTLVIRDICTSSVVAKFTVYGETIEEDERLRILTQNFGYNIVSTDSLIFKDTDIKEILPDYITVNRKRKEIMLEGHNIYPFIGSYKGLINAIKFFGYNDLQIREFWKNVNKASPRYGKYIQSNAVGLFDPIVDFNDMSITLPNKNFRKTSMFSLIYKINNIVPNEYNEDDLPVTVKSSDYTLEEVLIKLFGLKKKLESDFLPLNAHIRDIIGEGDYFGLLGLTNTISKNLKNNITAGINADFDITPEGCIYLQDLRYLEMYCQSEEAIVDEAIIEYCNAFIAPLGLGDNGANLLLGPINTGQAVPYPPIGPDLYGPFKYPFVDGADVTISSISDTFLSYFTRYAPNLKYSGYVDGWSSKYLPDKPDVPVGGLAVLQNTSFSNLTFNDIESTWEDISNANTFYTFNFKPYGVQVGDTFILRDSESGTQVSYEVQTGDTANDVVNELYTQLIALKASYIQPWLFWDISKETLPVGSVIRLYGQKTFNVQAIIEHGSIPGSGFIRSQEPGEILYTWDRIDSGNYAEIEWTIYKDQTEVSPAYYFTVRGPLAEYENFPISLPYVGTYSVEMKLYDLYNNISSRIKTDFICIDAKEVDYSGWYQSRYYDYTWTNVGNYLWEDYGSIWNLPIEPSITWDEETPSLYESLDRVNAILNNFGLGTSPDFQLLNYQDDGNLSFSGPYYWNNLDVGCWSDTYHIWWDMTSITGDTPAFFQFKEVVADTYLRIVDLDGTVGLFYFETAMTLAEAASELNLSTDPIINKYVYNVVYNAVSQEKYIQAVARYFGFHGDWQTIDIVDPDGNRICANYTGATGGSYTGITGVTGATGCESLIYRKGLHCSSNPTWSTAKFINDGKTLPKMTWIMFVYDKCRISGKKNPIWTIKNTADPNSSDIYFESKYLTYLFKNSGKYEISLELVDTNGNKYKKGKNILIIK